MDTKVIIATPSEVRMYLSDAIAAHLKHFTPPPPAPAPQEADRFLNQKEVAELLGVSTVSIWDYERKGFLQSYRIGQMKRFKLSEVMASPKRITRQQKGGGHD